MVDVPIFGRRIVRYPADFAIRIWGGSSGRWWAFRCIVLALPLPRINSLLWLDFWRMTLRVDCRRRGRRRHPGNASFYIGYWYY